MDLGENLSRRPTRSARRLQDATGGGWTTNPVGLIERFSGGVGVSLVVGPQWDGNRGQPEVRRTSYVTMPSIVLLPTTPFMFLCQTGAGSQLR
jgi:hypothetical protein